MEEILKYENRNKLYQFLIDDFGFKKVNEKYDDKAFGNFYIDLSCSRFLIRYVNDRSFLDVAIGKLSDEKMVHGVLMQQWFSLAMIRDLIYYPDRINDDNESFIWDNTKRIEKLNTFLKQDFYKISELFSNENYPETKNKIEEGARKTWLKYHPDHKI